MFLEPPNLEPDTANTVKWAIEAGCELILIQLRFGNEKSRKGEGIRMKCN